MQKWKQGEESVPYPTEECQNQETEGTHLLGQQFQLKYEKNKDRTNQNGVLAQENAIFI